jgi:hypothetical protein
VSARLPIDAAAKTLAHEAAHFTAEHRGVDLKQDKETVAESAAFVTMHHFGLDTSSYSFGYVAGWAQDKEVFKRNLQAIQKTSHQLIQGIERYLANPPHTAITVFASSAVR